MPAATAHGRERVAVALPVRVLDHREALCNLDLQVGGVSVLADRAPLAGERVAALRPLFVAFQQNTTEAYIAGLGAPSRF
jgi:hypothetical protein